MEQKMKIEKSWEVNVRKVVPYTPGEQPNQPDMIKLNTNENPYPPSPRVTQAIREFDAQQMRLYPDPTAEVLIHALAARYQVKPAQVFVGVGSDDVLAMSFLTFFNSDKPILFPDITYSFYDVWAEVFRIPYEKVPLDKELRICKTDYYKENGGVIFPNPNAPTGILQSLADIEDIVSHNRDVICIVDEAYIDFGGESALPLIGKYDNLLVVQTFSKSRAMAGARIGYAFGSERLIRYLNDVKYSFNSYTMDRLTLTIGAAALSDEAYFQETLGKITATRARVKKELTDLGFTMPDSKSNFLFVSHPAVAARELFAYLREKHIYVRYFDQPRINDRLRITIGTDEEMDALIACLKKYLKEKKLEKIC